MKKLLILIVLACASIAFSQSTTEIDSSLMMQKEEDYTAYYERIMELVSEADNNGRFAEMNKYVYAFASQPDEISDNHKDNKQRLLISMIIAGHVDIPKKVAEEKIKKKPTDFYSNGLMFMIYYSKSDNKRADYYLKILKKNAKTDKEKKELDGLLRAL